MKNIISILTVILISGCQNSNYPRPPKIEDVKRRFYNNEMKKPPLNVPKKLTLQDAKNIALSANPTPKIAASRVRVAIAKLNQNIAEMMPYLNLNVIYSQEQSRRNFTTGSPLHYENFNPQLQFDWLIYDGQHRHYLKEASNQELISERFNLKDSQRLISQAVAKTYYNAILQKEIIKIAEEDMAFNQKLIDEVKVRIKHDSATQIEMFNFQLRLNEAKINLLKAEESLENSRIILSELMGVKQLENSIILTTDIEEAKTEKVQPYKELFNKAQERPDVRSLWHAIHTEWYRLKAAEAANSPKVSIRLNNGYDRFDNTNFNENDREYHFQTQLQIPIFDFGRNRAMIKEAEANLSVQELIYMEKINTLKSNIKQTLSKIEATNKRIKILNDTVITSQKIKEIEVRKYRLEEVTLTRLNEVQMDVIKSKINSRLEKIQLLLLLEDLKAIVGE